MADFDGVLCTRVAVSGLEGIKEELVLNLFIAACAKQLRVIGIKTGISSETPSGDFLVILEFQSSPHAYQSLARIRGARVALAHRDPLQWMTLHAWRLDDAGNELLLPHELHDRRSDSMGQMGSAVKSAKPKRGRGGTGAFSDEASSCELELEEMPEAL